MNYSTPKELYAGGTLQRIGLPPRPSMVGGMSPEAPEARVKRFKTGIQNFGLISYPKPEEFYGGGNPPENLTTSQAF